MRNICVRVIIAVKKHHAQKKLVEDRVYLAYTSISLNKYRAGTQTRQELEGRS